MNFEYDIPTISKALEYLGKVLKETRNETIYQVIDKNQGRHKLITVNGKYYYVMFKKESLNKWNELYPQLLGIKDGIDRVDSMNRDLFYYVFNSKKINEIIIVYANHEIVSLDPLTWLERANQNHLFRKINRLDFNESSDYTGKDEYENADIISTYLTDKEVWRINNE